MRVIHFCRAFSPVSETFTYDYIIALEAQGIDNHVVTLSRQNEHSRPFKKIVVVPWQGKWTIRRLSMRFQIRLGLRLPAEFCLPDLSAMESKVTALRPDVIHAHFGVEGAAIAPVAAKLGIPLIVTFYGYDISQLPKFRRWRRYYRRLWREVSYITVLSEAMREDALRLGAPSEKIAVVHLGRILSSLPAKDVSRPARRFISVGRLVEKKGHLDTIRAMHRAVRTCPDLRLDIIGAGPLEPKVRELIGELKLNDRIKLLGSVQNHETLERMQKADAFILSCKTAKDGDKEGTPTVIVEALAIGLPCVTTSHAGIPEMFPVEQRQFLADEGDVDQICDRISGLANCPVEQLRVRTERAREYAARNFDVEMEAAKLVRLYSMAAGCALPEPQMSHAKPTWLATE